MVRRLVPVCLAGILLACGGTDNGAGPADTQPVSTALPVAIQGEQVVEGIPGVTVTGSDAGAVPAALRFSAPLVSGGQLELDSLAGRPVLLWFWAPW